MSEVKNQYLDFEVTEKVDSVEKIFCEQFSKLKTKPLNSEESKFLISLLFINDEDSKVLELKNDFLNPKHEYCNSNAIILERRFCDQYNFSLENRLLILISNLIDSPGKAVMFGTYLAYWAKINNKQKITLDDFCKKIFPWGLPTEEEIDNLWRKQKVKRPVNKSGSDNLLDYYYATTSLIQK